jgi:hypothetical protein
MGLVERTTHLFFELGLFHEWRQKMIEFFTLLENVYLVVRQQSTNVRYSVLS